MANLERWQPAREAMSLRDAMDRMFEESFLRPTWFGSADPSAVMAPVDVYETDEQVVVKVTLPGVKPEDIDVTITGDLLTVKGEFESEEKSEKRNYLRQERRYGSFCRQVNLPAGANTDNVAAVFEHGVLTLEVPKSEPMKAKTVKIEAK
jgi:HSP20 family protein